LEQEAAVASELRVDMQRQIARLTRELDEARATAATEAKRADHFAAEHAAAVKKGGRR
jgi:hypothetical protein